MKSTSTNEAEALRAAISRREAQLDQALEELVAAAEARASLGHYVARYPWQFLIGGLVVGAWLGRRR
ncbi:MAG: hypothetical protein LC659_12125 [Myxococcales bacterium]|nr:hypothetical protein [Myxococcales bacterium]